MAIWERLHCEQLALEKEAEACVTKLNAVEPSLSTENYLQRLKDLQEVEARLEKAESRRALVREQAVTLGQTVSSPSVTRLQDSALDYQLPGLRTQAGGLEQSLVKFQGVWQEYEDRQTTLQPWLALAEEQTEAGSQSLELLRAELEAYNRLREAANTLFSGSLETLPGLEDEEMQRRLHLQFEERWTRLASNLMDQNEKQQQKESKNIPTPVLVLEGAQQLLEQAKTEISISLSTAGKAEELLAILHKLTYLRNVLASKQRELRSLEAKEVEIIERVGELGSQLKKTQELLEQKIEDGNRILERSNKISKKTSAILMETTHLKAVLNRAQEDAVTGSKSAKIKMRSLQVIF